ncbi:hypothetical protein ARMGADRAFT_1092701 [Armillaria gallica]|uniref:Uncharacterized protein n=1 Tax=Armillaria gallica TaxID=47427 RepID=A0A2H3CDI7_ARMGA|nr:hypothetical protein ARMGADRAFT_1092701 [Armillaria gallica]
MGIRFVTQSTSGRMITRLIQETSQARHYGSERGSRSEEDDKQDRVYLTRTEELLDIGITLTDELSPPSTAFEHDLHAYSTIEHPLNMVRGRKMGQTSTVSSLSMLDDALDLSLIYVKYGQRRMRSESTRGVYVGYAENSGVYAEGSIWREVGVRGETSPEACYY